MSDDKEKDGDQDRDKDKDKEMDELSRAIVEALVKSDEVRTAMTRAAKKEDVCEGSFLVLMLKVKNLAQSMGVDVTRPCDMSCDEKMELDLKGVENAKPEDDIPPHSEDGRKLTQGEIAFREYMSSRFNEDGWLKKHGLIF